jgi:hypothetical protein
LDNLRCGAALYKENDYQNATYLLDKLLHHKLFFSNMLLNEENKFIIMLRKPDSALSSMIKMHHKLFGNENFSHLEYYYYCDCKTVVDS